MSARGAWGWALAAAIDRVLAGRVVGYGLNVQRDGLTFADHVYGYARAPWESALPATRWTSTTRCHIASMSKPITGFALALIIEKWNQVLDLPQQLMASRGFLGLGFPIPIPPFPWSPSIIQLFLQYCPSSVRPDPQWAYRVYQDGRRLTVASPLLQLIRDHLNTPPGAHVEQLTLQNLLEHHSYLQPQSGDDPKANFWGWASQLLGRGLSSDPTANTGDQYRNENYTLLRGAIESVSGVPYQSYVYGNVLAPAGATHFTMQNGDPAPTRYYRQMFPIANGIPQLPAPGIDFDGDFSAYGGADGWHGSPAEYALFLNFVLRHPYTIESAPIVRDHMGCQSWTTPAGTVYAHNGEWNIGDGAGNAGSFDGCFLLYPDHTTIVAMTNTSMTIGFEGLVSDAVNAMFPAIDQPRSFVPPIARYGGRLGDLRYALGAPVTAGSSAVAVDAAIPLAADAPDIKLAVFDGTAIVTPPVGASGAVQRTRAADTATTTAGLRALRLPWTDPRVPVLGTPLTTSVTTDPGATIAGENTAGSSNFAYVWWGYINAPSTGVYVFATNSDDGSVVWIDGVKVVDNDGLHAPTVVQGPPVPLSAGKHPIRIAFNQGGGGSTFELRWITPGATTLVAVPTSALLHA